MIISISIYLKSVQEQCNDKSYRWENLNVYKAAYLCICKVVTQSHNIAWCYISLQDLEEWSKIDVDAYIVVYSVTSRKSFQKGRDLMFNIRNLVQSDAAMILVANKSDLKRARCVPESGTSDLGYDLFFLILFPLSHQQYINPNKSVISILIVCGTERFGGPAELENRHDISVHKRNATFSRLGLKMFWCITTPFFCLPKHFSLNLLKVLIVVRKEHLALI